jgi:hypothetical protein
MDIFRISIVIATLLVASAGVAVAEEPKKTDEVAARQCNYGGETVTLEAACGDQTGSVCKAYVEKRYPSCVDLIQGIRHDVSQQKHTADEHHEKGWLGLRAWQGISIFLAFAAALAVAFADKSVWIKAAGVACTAGVSAVGSILVLYSLPVMYSAELQARLELAELQSDIENALILGWAPISASDPEKRETITDFTVGRWQARMAAILRKDTESYAKSDRLRKPSG